MKLIETQLRTLSKDDADNAFNALGLGFLKFSELSNELGIDEEKLTKK